MPREYSLEQVKQVYSMWGRSPLFYRMGVWLLGYDSYIRRRAVERLQLKPGDVVVDLACGPGITFKLLERKIGSRGKLIAVDYVSEMIEGAKKIGKRWKNIKYVKADAAKLDLPAKSVDAMICTLGMSAIPDHLEAMNRCKRMLKDSGRLVVVDGKNFKYRFLNPLLDILRWNKSYEKKDVLSDLKKVFRRVETEEHLLGSTFISVARK